MRSACLSSARAPRCRAVRSPRTTRARDVDVAGRVGGLALVPMRQRPRSTPCSCQDVLLHVAPDRVLAVADDRTPDSAAAIAAPAITLRSCSPGGSVDAILMSRVGCGRADPVVDLVEVKLRDLSPSGPASSRGCRCARGRSPWCTRCACRTLGHLGHRSGHAEVDRTGIDERAHTVQGQARHTLDRGSRRTRRGPSGRWGRARPG